MILSPSLACADYLRMGDNIRQLINAGMEVLHIDIMDGHYVPNLCLNLDLLRSIRKEYTVSRFDTHLMVDNPLDYIKDIAEIGGTEYLSFHLSSTTHIYRVIENIKTHGIKAGIIINPSEPVSLLENIVESVDMVSLMAVEPGFSGQKFMPMTYTKLERLAGLRKDRKLNFIISIDGGIDPENGKKCAMLGADMLILGYFAIFNQPDGIIDAYKRFSRSVKTGS